jgi:Leucine-rich repeat (LRR) protein
MLEELLETLPQVNQLFLRHYAFDPTWNYILSRPSKWTILDLQGIHIYEDSVFLENTPFTNLEKLRCGFDNGGTLYLPPRLTNLDFCYFDRQPASILNVITSRIRFLRILTRHFVQSTDFARLPHLQHLELLEFGDEDDKDRKLGGLLESCRHLSSLTLNSDDWFLTADLSYLLQRLPASLLRIDFAYYTSLKSLNDLLEKGPLKSIRILGVSEGYEEAEELNDLRTLKRLCGKRRIKVKEITHAPSPFGEFSIPSHAAFLFSSLFDHCGTVFFACCRLLDLHSHTRLPFVN